VELDALGLNWLTSGQDLIYNRDGSLAYLALPNENAVAVFDTATWGVVAQIDTGCAPYLGTEPVWLQLSPDGHLYVVNELSDNVLVVDTATNQVSDVMNLRMCQTWLPLVSRE
jgi:YVTN family beta-propeller protein